MEYEVDHGRHNVFTYMETEPTCKQKRKEKEKKKKKKKEKSIRKRKKDIKDLELQTIM